MALAALLLAPRAGAASNFTVTPTEVNLSTSTTSALVTLRNLSKSPLRFEITVFKWSEDEKGKMILEPSADVTFFPKLVELAGGASRNIRIGINAGVARDVEQSFRLFVEELPDQSAPSRQRRRDPHQGRHSGVRPARQAGPHGGDRRRLGRRRQGPDTREQHRQPAHQRRERSGQGHGLVERSSTFSKDGPGWYVLPGATRIFEVPMTAGGMQVDLCRAVEVFGHNTSLKGASQVSPARAPRPET